MSYTNLWFINVITSQPILYTNDVNGNSTYTNILYEWKWNSTYTKPVYYEWKTTILCMCHDLGMWDAIVDLTWVPCLYLKNAIARGFSISRILCKWPPIEVMQQEHAKYYDGTYQSIFFPTTLILIG